MTYSNADSALESSSTALLALKRFVKSTLKQVGIGLVSLMTVLNLSMHAPERSPSNLSSNIAELTAEPTHSTSQPAFGQSAYALVPSDSLAALASQAPIVSLPLERRIERRMGRGITYHHVTGARLSITTAPEQAIVSVAKAG